MVPSLRLHFTWFVRLLPATTTPVLPFCVPAAATTVVHLAVPRHFCCTCSTFTHAHTRLRYYLHTPQFFLPPRTHIAATCCALRVRTLSSTTRLPVFLHAAFACCRRTPPRTHTHHCVASSAGHMFCYLCLAAYRLPFTWDFWFPAPLYFARSFYYRTPFLLSIFYHLRDSTHLLLRLIPTHYYAAFIPATYDSFGCLPAVFVFTHHRSF